MARTELWFQPPPWRSASQGTAGIHIFSYSSIFFYRSVPRNLWLPSLRRRQELLSSALACVENVLRHCMQTKPDSMLLRSKLMCCSGEFSYVLIFPEARHAQAHLIEFCMDDKTPLRWRQL